MCGSIFVLVVDDDVSFADAAARSFESVGMRTLLVLGSMPSIRFFEANDIDVIITDIKVAAGGHRASALRRMLSAKQPNPSIVLMTAHPELLKEDVETETAALCSPLDVAELCRAIRVHQTQ
jgi:DNA-binding response OmpR family regulator